LTYSWHGYTQSRQILSVCCLPECWHLWLKLDAAAAAVPPGIVEENPELLFRMDYYQDAMLLDDLPIEIQNMMVLADQGLGFLYRYYNAKRKDKQKQQQQQQQQQQLPPFQG
jgi:hypothetical protein